MIVRKLSRRCRRGRARTACCRISRSTGFRPHAPFLEQVFPHSACAIGPIAADEACPHLACQFPHCIASDGWAAVLARHRHTERPHDWHRARLCARASVIIRRGRSVGSTFSADPEGRLWLKGCSRTVSAVGLLLIHVPEELRRRICPFSRTEPLRLSGRHGRRAAPSVTLSDKVPPALVVGKPRFGGAGSKALF
jgi:hypothetical protein